MQPRVRIEFECALDHPSSHLASAGRALMCGTASGGREFLAMIKLREFWRCIGEACEKCGSVQTRPTWSKQVHTSYTALARCNEREAFAFKETRQNYTPIFGSVLCGTRCCY